VLFTTLLITSWNVTATHCAFSAAIGPAPSTAQKDVDECPMHAATKAAPQPEKKKGCADSPCCKNLPATAPMAGVFVGKSPATFATVDYISRSCDQLDLDPWIRLTVTLATGPPGADNFVELVLQRSIPAHAPPGTAI
jgi:hypothetical protein